MNGEDYDEGGENCDEGGEEADVYVGGGEGEGACEVGDEVSHEDGD